jgi:UDP-glucose 4-epimerase
MKAVVTGGAGFIGSHLAERLVELGYDVIVLDNLSTGRKEFLSGLDGNRKFGFVKTDLLKDDFERHIRGADEVYHLAANADVKIGNTDTKIHFDQNVVVTYRVLESCRNAGVKKFVFASSSTVYGESKTIPTPEDSPLEPVSMYGASKLAGESLTSSYAHNFGMRSCVLRLANVIGGRSTHGVITDFVRKLGSNPNELEVLGDGMQSKSYVHISDCIDAIITAAGKSRETFQIFNVGSEDQADVKAIARIVSEGLGLKPEFRFTGGRQGWVGDVPNMRLDVSRLKKLGWKPKYSSGEAVMKAVKEAATNVDRA